MIIKFNTIALCNHTFVYDVTLTMTVTHKDNFIYYVVVLWGAYIFSSLSNVFSSTLKRILPFKSLFLKIRIPTY